MTKTGLRLVGFAPVLGLAAILAGCAGEKVWMRSGSGPSDARYDEMSCAEEAEKSGVSVSIGGEAGPPMDRFSSRYACLRARGYKLVPLTADEAAKLNALGGMEKEDYWRGLLARNGFTPAPNAPAQDSPATPAPAQ